MNISHVEAYSEEAADAALRYRINNTDQWLYGESVKKYAEEYPDGVTRQHIMDMVLREGVPQYVSNFAHEYAGLVTGTDAINIVASGSDAVAALNMAKSMPDLSEDDRCALRGAVQRSGDKSILYAYAVQVDKVPLDYITGLRTEVEAESKAKNSNDLNPIGTAFKFMQARSKIPEPAEPNAHRGPRL